MRQHRLEIGWHRHGKAHGDLRSQQENSHHEVPTSATIAGVLGLAVHVRHSQMLREEFASAKSVGYNESLLHGMVKSFNYVSVAEPFTFDSALLAPTMDGPFLLSMILRVKKECCNFQSMDTTYICHRFGRQL